MMRWAASTAPCKCAVSRSRLPGLDYTFNPYSGCTHGCLYCYVPDIMHNRALSSNWGRSVAVKEDVLRKLKDDLRRLKPGVVGVSTVTDPYQPIEGSLGVTRQAISILKAASFPISIQTKSPLVTRDADIIRGGNFEVGMTITSRGGNFSSKFEPGAPPIAERSKALRELSARGVMTWIFYGPIIPGENDLPEDAEFVAKLARETKSWVLYDRLNIKPMLRSRMLTVCTESDLMRMMQCDSKVFYGVLESACRESGVQCHHAFA